MRIGPVGPGVGALIALMATSALTTVPASEEEILCHGKMLVAVTVKEARSHDCDDGYCTPIVGITGTIERVFPASLDTLHVGEKLSASFNVLDEEPILIGNEWFPRNESNRASLGWPITKGAITTAAAKAELQGRRLFLSLTPREELTTGLGDAADADWRKSVGEPYFGAVYEPSEEKWLEETWAKCRRPERG